MLSKKMESITQSLTVGISSKVKELELQGVKITDLSIGEQDFLHQKKLKTSV